MTSRPSDPNTVRIFGLDLHAATLEETARRCIELAQQISVGDVPRRPALVFSLNPEKVIRSARDPAVQTLLQKATLLNPDGVGICLAARLLSGRRLQRVAGSDLMPMLCSLAEKKGLSVYVYGASAESNARAVKRMIKTWPALKIVGASDGFQPPGTAAQAIDGPGDSVARRIAELQPDIVFVGLGSPRQELWMAEVGLHLPVGLMQGVGGTIDVMSGIALRAPAVWRRFGLEWLYRLLKNPRRWRRQTALLGFSFFVLRRRLGQVFGNASGKVNGVVGAGGNQENGRT